MTRPPGRAVHVGTHETLLIAPACMLSKQRCDGPLSNAAFGFNLRRFTEDAREDIQPDRVRLPRRQAAH